MTYTTDRQWSDKFLPEIVIILENNAKYLLNVRISGEEKDKTEATDLQLKTDGGDIAVRILREKKYNTFTIRSYRSSGSKTELAKLKEGYCRWYFFGWCKDDKLSEWIIIDVNKLRESGLLDAYETIMNKDQTTGFIAIPLKDLSFHDCIVAFNIVELPAGPDATK